MGPSAVAASPQRWTESSCSQQVSESGRRNAAPASAAALLPGLKHGLGTVSLMGVITSNT